MTFWILQIWHIHREKLQTKALFRRSQCFAIGVPRRWRKQEATAADIPLKPQKKMEKKHGCILARKEKNKKAFGGDVFLLARAGVSLQQESWSCGYLARRAAEHLIVNVLRWTARPITFTVYFHTGVWAPTLPSPNMFYRPFTRWTRDTNASGPGKCSVWRARLSKDSRVASSTHLSSRVMDCLKLKVLR